MNSSIFSIILGSQIAFSIPFIVSYFKNKYNAWCKVFIIILSIGLLANLIYTNGRSGWLGFIIAALFVAFKNVPSIKTNKFYCIVALVFIGTLLTLLFSVKQNSSYGRLFIYKISLKLFFKNRGAGIGYGRFKYDYNTAQANYFSTANIDGKAALLADNTYYAFNDYLQFVIEFGVVGIVLLGLLATIIIWQIKLTANIVKYKIMYIGCNAAIISIAMGAMFSYPMQHYVIQFITLKALLVLAIIIIKQKIPNKLKLILYKIYCAALTGLLLFITVLFCIRMHYNFNKEKAKNLQRIGYSTAALGMYKQLAKSPLADGAMLFEYAQTLNNVNKLDSALFILNKSQQQVTFSDQYLLAAAIHAEQKNYITAEQNLKKALYIVPNRMGTRLQLMQFYLLKKDTLQARHWANSILNMPIKIPSKRTENMIKKTIDILKLISK